ncbi:MAG: carbamoyltransferase HypF [Thermoanaerobaculia bacterium]|nr:carbamoyltransferase HypF [Thermoanaerobaculia bacterium]
MSHGARIEVRGTVQGVGYRPWVYRVASEEKISGRVWNHTAGVTIEAFGDVAAIGAFLQRIRTSSPPAARVTDVSASPIAYEELSSFSIEQSSGAAEIQVSIPPDLATCDDCARDIADPANRRFRYAFTNCTNCGPRFTIANDVPYDRAATTMAKFEMCPACRSEYDSPLDRRFHAQPNACPDCGPRLTLVDSHRDVVASADPIADAARALLGGGVVAIKGLGGFHLACDATSPSAVARLRLRKRRDEKPFALMVRDLEEATRLAELTPAERRELESVERPIVLCRKLEGAPIAPGIAPLNRLVGLMLPYTPLHHLLLAEVARPLVMTSANFADEPIAFRNDDALARLAPVADLLLMHDRDIETRCDDSVVRVIAGAPTVLRRSRGYVPRALEVGFPFAAPVLACGAQLKNTFAIGSGDRVHLGPHVGDLENVETLASYEESIARMERFLRVRPAAVAHDLHPDYLSTRYAIERPEVAKIAVQHHHAHIAAVMAEHRIDGPVLGLAWDGTGLGTDGTAWGGELLLARYDRFERLATLRAIPLAGGDTAIREVWRLAVAVLDDAFGPGGWPDGLPIAGRLDSAAVKVVRSMLASGLNTIPSHGAGRWFDAFGAIFLGRDRSRYEGQIALEWNLAADESERIPFSFDIDRNARVWTIDLRPAVVDAVRAWSTGTSIATIAGRFHATLSSAATAAIHLRYHETGRLPVALGGGCFLNALLTESLLRDLTPDFDVAIPRAVPPGDGGIAFGQAVVANAILQRGGHACAWESPVASSTSTT